MIVFTLILLYLNKNIQKNDGWNREAYFSEILANEENRKRGLRACLESGGSAKKDHPCIEEELWCISELDGCTADVSVNNVLAAI